MHSTSPFLYHVMIFLFVCLTYDDAQCLEHGCFSQGVSLCKSYVIIMRVTVATQAEHAETAERYLH